jgi:phenylalanyl-tRNA synthetase beta chain
MYISFNWLKDLVKIPNNLKASELAPLLNLHTVEVERLINQEERFASIKVAKILEISKHPKADRLQIVELDSGDSNVRVVCGATNIKISQKVALALPGAVLNNNLEIKEAEIRGEQSFGMICSEEELGLGNDSEGILVLKEKAKIGQSLAKYLGLDDVILEIDNKSLSHRGDLWGHYGLAREISAILKVELKDYSQFIKKPKSIEGEKLIVKVEDKKLCPRYLAWRVDNLKIESSPDWLKNRLISAGLKPINNIVDATNYVMLETGQPLHAFSADKVNNLIVRLAKKGEKLETLDNKERLLTEEDLVIASEKNILAIAGVMGGLDSSVNLKTNSIILESANFDSVSVRKTSQSLNLRTEASSRFEKALDPELASQALYRLATIIKQICKEAEFINEPVDLVNYDSQISKISLSFNWLFERLGQEIEKEEVIFILKYLGFEVVVDEQKENIEVKVPSWRAVKDVKNKEDILEEVARIFSYNKIQSKAPVLEIKPLIDNPELKLERKIKDFLSKTAKLSEVYNYAFVSNKQLTKAGIDTSNFLCLANPVSENHDLLRQSLFSGLLQNIATNQFNFKDISIFEISRVFFSIDGHLNKDGGNDKLPYQEKRLAIAIAGFSNPFLKVKGVVQSLFKDLFTNNLQLDFIYLENRPIWADKNSSVSLKLANEELGLIALVDKEMANNFGLKIESAIVEINFAKLLDIFMNFPDKKYQDLFKYPAVSRDLAFVINKKVSYNELYKEIINFDELIVSAELFDVYQGDKLGDDLKSLAFHVNYRSFEKTLSSQEVDDLQRKLLKFLDEKFSARLRDF